MRTETGQSFITYSRCSTEEQQKKGNSHEYQQAGIRRSGVVQVGKLREVALFSDTVTGTRFDNRASGLDAAYKICERQRGTVDYIFVYRWDRFGRSVEHCFAAIRQFREVGVEVNCPDEWIDYSDPSWPLILSVKFGMAQSESMRISDRTKDGVHAAQLAGFYTANAPVGYRKAAPENFDGKQRRLCVPDDKAAIVAKCFERYAAGENKLELFAQHRQALGVSKSQFCRMFHNPFYCGLIYVKPYRGNPVQLVPGKHEGIISRELFEQCQKIQEQAGHPASGKTWTTRPQPDADGFFLKGILKCPISGRNMTAYRSRGKSGRYFPYYASQGGGRVRIPAQKAHYLIGLALQGFRIDPEHEAEIRQEIDRQLSERSRAVSQQLDQARRGIDRTQSRLSKIRADYADDLIGAGEYRDMRQTFESDLVRFENEMLQAEQAQGENDGFFLKVLTLLSGIDTVFAASSPEYKNRILQAVFPQGVTIDKSAEKVRTPCVNQIITELCSKSITCAALEIENGPNDNARPVKGGQGDTYRTHLTLLKQLFAA